jgi:hypothetical protein
MEEGPSNKKKFWGIFSNRKQKKVKAKEKEAKEMEIPSTPVRRSGSYNLVSSCTRSFAAIKLSC